MAEQLCVVTAADIEFKTVAKLLADSALVEEAGLKVMRGHYGTRPVTLLKTEIGAAGFAAKLRAHLAANRYTALVVIGLAGGLDPALRAGDVVVYDRCLDARAKDASIACDVGLSEQLFEALRAAGLTCARGAGVLTERVIIEAHGKHSLRQQTRAAAVDMETYLVWAAAASAIPCAAVRVVLDEATRDLPDFNAGLDAAGRVKLAPTLRALAARPWVTLQFLRSLRPALRSLERAARVVLTVAASR